MVIILYSWPSRNHCTTVKKAILKNKRNKIKTKMHVKQRVCLTNFIWHSTSNPKYHVTFSKTKKECQSTCTFSSKMSPQCPCLVVRVISISNVSIDMWFFLHKSHYMSNFKFVGVNWRALHNLFFSNFFSAEVFACQMSKIHTDVEVGSGHNRATPWIARAGIVSVVVGLLPPPLLTYSSSLLLTLPR